jgi:glycosyltransferase involved in cell wall biosynthesis
MHNYDDTIIVIFSKDRPDRLNLALPQLPAWPRPPILLDDSVSVSNQAKIKWLGRKFGLVYHGRNEQQMVLDQVPLPYVKKFVATLGKNQWSLGFNRNYALIYSLLTGAKRVLFMDDDIIITHPNQLKSLMNALLTAPFIGAEIDLMPDYSTLGHIYKIGGSSLPGYTSGGFLGINLTTLNHFFLNSYNEDWIWLFLQNEGRSVDKVGAVNQLIFNPFHQWETTASFQEFGEVLWKGVLNSPPTDRDLFLMDRSFWREILKIRIQELRQIEDLSFPDSFRQLAYQIRDFILDLHRHLLPERFAQEFVQYYHRLEEWRGLVSILLEAKRYEFMGTTK